MTEQFPALLVTIPLLCACLITAAGWIRRGLCFPLAVLALSVALVSASGLALQVLYEGVVEYRLGGWPAPWGIVYHIDHLNALVLLVVSGSALLNLISSQKAIEEEQKEKAPTFYTLYVLAVTGLLGMVVTGDAFNLYVLLEISSLTGYALIATGHERAPLASLNYVFLGTIGASFYLLGVGFIYMVTGSLNMADIAGLLPDLYSSRAVLAAFVLIVTGVWLKAAFFPLHAWLPNAYTFANAPASALLAPLMTKVMIYVMIRMMLTVFTPVFVFSRLGINTVVVWMAVAAIVLGAVMALSQRDLKRMSTYIIISEVGYMVGGAWLGNRTGMTGAILHIINDAVMTLCVFMVVSNIVYKTKGYAFEDLKGLFRKMPYTMGCLVVAALSIIGVPPTCGFFSKWYLLTGAMTAGYYGFAAALIFSSLISVILFFRVFEIAFFEPWPAHESGHGGGHAANHAHPLRIQIAEAPLNMVIPLLLVAAGLVVIGLYTGNLIGFISQALPQGLG